MTSSNTPPLPTTAMSVDAWLRANADFRGIDEHGQVYYLLGMCEAKLAQANAEIELANQEIKRLQERLIDAS